MKLRHLSYQDSVTQRRFTFFIIHNFLCLHALRISIWSVIIKRACVELFLMIARFLALHRHRNSILHQLSCSHSSTMVWNSPYRQESTMISSHSKWYQEVRNRNSIRVHMYIDCYQTFKGNYTMAIAGDMKTCIRHGGSQFHASVCWWLCHHTLLGRFLQRGHVSMCQSYLVLHEGLFCKDNCHVQAFQICFHL